MTSRLIAALIAATSFATHPQSSAATSASAQQSAPANRPPAADITGTWTASFETPIGPMQYTYEFTVAGNTLTGKATSDAMGSSAITDGVVDGPDVTFGEMLDNSIRTVYTGTIVSKDEIKFSRTVGEFGTEELVAKRKPVGQK